MYVSNVKDYSMTRWTYALLPQTADLREFFLLRPVLRKHFTAIDRLDEQFMICIQWYLDTWLAIFEIFRCEVGGEFIALKRYQDIYGSRL